MKKFLILALALTLVGFLTAPQTASAAMMLFKGEYEIQAIASDNVHDMWDGGDSYFPEINYWLADTIGASQLAALGLDYDPDADALGLPGATPGQTMQEYFLAAADALGALYPYIGTKDESNYVDQRFRLLSIAASTNVKGFLQVEVGWDEWGKDYSNSGMGIYGTDGTDFGAVQTIFNTAGDNGMVADDAITNVAVRWAFVDFTVPNTSLSFKLGKQPIYGYDQVFMTAAGPAPGVEANYKFGKNQKIKAFWAKMVEGDMHTSDVWGEGDSDHDLFYVEYSQKKESLGFGGYVGYNMDHREKWTSRSGLGGTWDMLYFASPDAVLAGTAGNLQAKPWNIDTYYLGGFTDFKIGPVKNNLHAIYSFGEWDSQSSDYPDIDAGGYYARWKATMPINSYTLKTGLLYGSADKDPTDDKLECFAFIEPPSRLPLINLSTDGPNLLWWGGSGNTTEEYADFPTGSGLDSLGRLMANLAITVPLHKKLSLYAEYWYMQTLEKDVENFRVTLGGGVRYVRDTEIGHELDLELRYAMTKTLTLTTEFDYLVAGDYWKLSDDHDPDNAWIAALAMKYAF